MSNQTPAVFSNTSAVAVVDGDPIATIHASDMADALAAYTRSTALIVDTSDLHMIREALEEMQARYGQHDAARRLAETISSSVEAGLR